VRRVVQAFYWGVKGGLSLAGAGHLAIKAAAILYVPKYTQFPVAFLFLPLGAIAGFALAAIARLAWPRWTHSEMLSAVVVLALSYGALVVGWSKANAAEAYIKMRFEPTGRLQAVSCSDATCPQQQPPRHWIVRARMTVYETTHLGGHIDSFDLIGWEPHRKGLPTLTTGRVHVDADQIIRAVGTNRVDPGGSLSLPVGYSYRTTTGGSSGRLVVWIYFVDNNGHRQQLVSGSEID